MARLCIIPARGGSKRIPRKNIKDFLGKPIIAYSIEAALSSGLFEEVMVSTDDKEIANVARSFGAKVPFMRSANNADDFATTLDVIREVLKGYNQSYNEVCCLYPTAPFVSPESLNEAHQKLVKGGFDSVFPVLRFSFPIQRAMKVDGDQISMFYPENLNSRSQDLESAFHDAGQFYWIKPEKVLEQNSLWTANSSFIELEETQAQDIDNESDWSLAELKFKLSHR